MRLCTVSCAIFSVSLHPCAHLRGIAAEKTLGDVFDSYSDPEAEPLTQLPPKHILYYNLGLKMPGGPHDEEPTPRSDEEDDEEKGGGDDDEDGVRLSPMLIPFILNDCPYSVRACVGAFMLS